MVGTSNLGSWNGHWILQPVFFYGMVHSKSMIIDVNRCTYWTQIGDAMLRLHFVKFPASFWQRRASLRFRYMLFLRVSPLFPNWPGAQRSWGWSGPCCSTGSLRVQLGVIFCGFVWKSGYSKISWRVNEFRILFSFFVFIVFRPGAAFCGVWLLGITSP